MANLKTHTVPFRRKREGKTNYKKRLELLKSSLPRLIIRISNKYVTAQIINYNDDGDKVVVGFNSKELEKHGWNYSKKSLPAAYLTGIVIAKKALEKGITKAILDLGLQTKGEKLFSCLKGAIDAGLDVPADDNIFPDESRISGVHISKIKNVEFSGYKKNKLSVEKLPEVFDSVKKKLIA